VAGSGTWRSHVHRRIVSGALWKMNRARDPGQRHPHDAWSPARCRREFGGASGTAAIREGAAWRDREWTVERLTLAGRPVRPHIP